MEGNFYTLNISDMDNIYSLMRPGAREAGTFCEETMKKVLGENMSFGFKIKEELVGFCLNTRREEGILLFLIIVKEEHRKKGIGTKLIQATIDYVQKNLEKDIKLYLHTSPSNTPAINLYTKMGFKVAYTIPDFYVKMIPKGGKKEEGKNYDAYRMIYSK